MARRKAKRARRKASRRGTRRVRKATRKSARRKHTHKRAARKAKVAPKTAKTAQKTVGLITHFYPNISVGIVDVKAPLALGDTIRITGHGRNFTQKVTSMQIEHEPISAAKKGDIIGLKVVKPVKEKDVVLK